MKRFILDNSPAVSTTGQSLTEADRFRTIDIGGMFGAAPDAHQLQHMRANVSDAAFYSGVTTITSQLVRYEDELLQPLGIFTYLRDIPYEISRGDDFSEYIQHATWSWDVSGGAFDNLVASTAEDMIPTVQLDREFINYKVLLFNVATKLRWLEVQKLRSIPNFDYSALYGEAVRRIFEQWTNHAAYLGFARYGTSGLVNNPDVTATTVPAGAAGGTQWATKTNEERVADVQMAFATIWAASAYDPSASPTRILLPPEQYVMLTSTVQQYSGGDTIFEWLALKNLTTQTTGEPVQILPLPMLKGAGVGGTDRMVIYTPNRRFMRMQEMVPLRAAMVEANIQHFSYDTIYTASTSELQILYGSTIGYFDGI